MLDLEKSIRLKYEQMEDAKHLKCQACIDHQRGEQLKVPVSVNSRVVPWECVCIDCFEVVFPQQKIRPAPVIVHVF